nr:DNA gyraseDNA topoisomerase IV subunit A [Mimivirus sp.]
METKNNDGKGWTIKYYKGLGTSTQAEAQECFTDLDKKRIKYFWESKRINNIEEDEEESKPKSKVKSEFIDEESDVISEIYKPKNKDICEDAITLAFDKKRENDRKIWVNTYNPNNYIDNAQKRVSYYDFIHQELISFSVDDNLRSIPNIMDGFKPSQRKVFYGSVEEGIYKEEIKVSELQGAVSKRTKYHHGEQSLTSTIVNMAQNYVGSNNINLLMPNGQFGTRMSGGKDSASARYIFTQLDELAKKYLSNMILIFYIYNMKIIK